MAGLVTVRGGGGGGQTRFFDPTAPFLSLSILKEKESGFSIFLLSHSIISAHHFRAGMEQIAFVWEGEEKI